MKKLILFIVPFFLIFAFPNATKAICSCYCDGNYAGDVDDSGGMSANETCHALCGSRSYSCGSGPNTNPTGGPGVTSGAPVKLDDPLGGVTPQKLIGRVIAAALGLVGSLALAMFIYGGFMWMTAMGNSDKVKKGRDTMIWAALGLIIIFTAYTLVNFVITNVVGAVK